MTYVIAEVGSNWRSLDDCLESIRASKQAGADAVKFQTFTGYALFGVEPPDSWNVELELPIDWLPALKAEADLHGIDFLCTAFSPELVAAVDPFVKAHKIASSDLKYPQLLHSVAKTGKPVLLSTGASSVADINHALQALDGCDVTLLYCVAAYPARTIDLRTIDLMRSLFDVPVGFSDHSTDVVGLPIEAVEQYAIPVLEKHFTAFPDLASPDRPHSLTADEFKTMVDHIRGHKGPVIAPSAEEGAMVLRHNRRLVVTADVQVDDILRYGVNYGAYRSLEDDARGLSPFLWEHVEGKRATRELKRGKGVGQGDFA